jgi:hypothetical protein
MLTRSILGSAKGRKLLEVLPKLSGMTSDAVAVHMHTHPGLFMQATARRCYRVVEKTWVGSSLQTTTHFTGGVEIEVRLPCEIRAGRSIFWGRLKKRLRPGWSDQQFVAAADDLICKAARLAVLKTEQDIVQAYVDEFVAESHSQNEAVSLLEESARTLGLPLMYEDMSADDCKAWTDELDRICDDAGLECGRRREKEVL